MKPEDIPEGVPEEIRSYLLKYKPEPPELVQKRERLIEELDKQIKTSSGTLQQLLRKLHLVLKNLNPQVPYDPSLTADFEGLLTRYAKDPSAPKPPPEIANEVMAYMAEHLAAVGLADEAPSAPAAAKAPAAPAGKAPLKKDGFEGSAQQKVALNAEQVAPAPAAKPEPGKPAMESFQVWTRNPSFGKTRG